MPGGTVIRAGAHLAPGVVVMPPAYVNIGAWIGPDAMVDSHVLVGPAGLVLARVLDVKEVGDRTGAILDAGIHTALRPTLVGGGHRLRLLTSEQRQPGHVIAAGPLCTGPDVFPEPLDRIPAIRDLVAILDLGAIADRMLLYPKMLGECVRSSAQHLTRVRCSPVAADLNPPRVASTTPTIRDEQDDVAQDTASPTAERNARLNTPRSRPVRLEVLAATAGDDLQSSRCHTSPSSRGGRSAVNRSE